MQQSLTGVAARLARQACGLSGHTGPWSVAWLRGRKESRRVTVWLPLCFAVVAADSLSPASREREMQEASVSAALSLSVSRSLARLLPSNRATDKSGREREERRCCAVGGRRANYRNSAEIPGLKYSYWRPARNPCSSPASVCVPLSLSVLRRRDPSLVSRGDPLLCLSHSLLHPLRSHARSPSSGSTPCAHGDCDQLQDPVSHRRKGVCCNSVTDPFRSKLSCVPLLPFSPSPTLPLRL